MEIINDVILAQTLNSIALIAIANVSDRILSLLQNKILEETYGSHGPNKYYLGGTREPSKEFLHAWKWNPVVNTVNSITKELFYDFLSMRYFGEMYQHGSPFEDRREELAEDLNVLGVDLNNDWGGAYRRPYWNDFLFELFQEDQLSKWFDDELFNLGFDRI
jgi:hypothetical protein